MTDKQPPRIIVCTGKNCDAVGEGSAIYKHLDAILDAADFFNPPFKLRTATCLDMCERGPNMVIYPGNRRYDHLTIEKVDAILAEEVYTQES